MKNKLPYKYVWYTGLSMSDSMTDSYNRLTDEIERCELDGMDSKAESVRQERFNLGKGVVYNVDK